MTDAYTIEDVEFLRHGDKPLFARLYVPHGAGPFRIVIELHGGVWTLNDRTHTAPVHKALAKAGIAVAALDFRQGADGAYPRSVADVHYGIRWVKANAHLLKGRADCVGICSQSTGAHIAALLAIRPNEARYAAINSPAVPASIDATFNCLTMFWPVVNPAGRYRFAKKVSGEPNPPDWAVRHVPMHETYFGSEAGMEEGSPLGALQRGEAATLPPAIWIQPKEDQQHLYRDPKVASATDAEMFLAEYRKRGPLEQVFYDAPQYFTLENPEGAPALDAFARVAAFFHAHIPDPAKVNAA